jgi:tRNA pseudouridine(38-40) synthase
VFSSRTRNRFEHEVEHDCSHRYVRYVYSYQMCELLVHGSGFLWHQIRCLVSLLILIGQGKEEIELVQALLDIDKYPSTPNYQIASGTEQIRVGQI